MFQSIPTLFTKDNTHKISFFFFLTYLRPVGIDRLVVEVTCNLGGRKDLNAFLGKKVFQRWVSANLVVFTMFALKTELNLQY